MKYYAVWWFLFSLYIGLMVVVGVHFYRQQATHAALVETLNQRTLSIYNAVQPPKPNPATTETCITGTLIVPDDWGGFLAIGNQEICGVGLRFGDTIQGYVGGK